ncbi:MAG TPA: hypothetical protein VG935_00570 [Patescibacteria group bacterium]|nr:hypothetical protein [Patescibacteria group bacterium]
MRFRQKLLNSLIILLPFAIIFLIGRGIIFDLFSPSWGDLVAMPTVRLPLSYLFYPWTDTYIGSFGSAYFPHVIFSQLIPLFRPSLLQFVHFYFVFVVLFITFVDFFRSIKNKFSRAELFDSALLTLAIFFSNTFTVNFLQGNPDIYYTYLLTIPVILYLYQTFKYKSILPTLKLSLVISITLFFAQFALYYIVISIFPFFILFIILFKSNVKKIIIPLVIAGILIIFSNLPPLYTTLKPALSAFDHIVTKQQSVSNLVSESFVLYTGINSVNLTYFAGNSGDYSWLLFNIPGGYLFVHNVFYSLLPFELIFVIGAILSLKWGKKKITLPGIIVGLSAIFILSFLLIIIWDTSFFSLILKKIPFTSLFRNPRKLIFMVYISFIIIIVFLRQFLSSQRFTLLLGSILVINFIALAPLMLDGFDGVKKTSDLDLAYQGISQKYYQSYFNETESFSKRFVHLYQIIQKNDQAKSHIEYRIMILPDNNQSTYQNIRYLLNTFYVSGSYAIWADISNPETVLTSLYSAIINKSSDISNFLKMGNVKYIVIDRKSPYRLFTSDSEPKVRYFYSAFTTGDPELFNKDISGLKYLKLIAKDDYFYVYQNIQYQEDVVYSPQRVCDQKLLLRKDFSCDLYLAQPEGEYLNNVLVSNVSRQNLTTYHFILQSKAAGKTTIFFTQAYDTDWTLSSSDPQVKVYNHTIGNTFGNAWEISLPRSGKYSFVISFETQQLYAFFVIVSTVFVSINIIGIIILERKEYGKK